ncbi:MAG: DoxX family protein [Bacteroidetes bacterium]|nr:DoxX family protein [Bacteroidota bacterium]
MKILKIAYWVVTGLMAAFITLGAITDLMNGPNVMAFFKHLGYPGYFARLIGALKILGVIGTVIPKYPRVREWAYAGLTFDVCGALSSHLLNGDGPSVYFPAVLGILLVTASYVLYRKCKRRSLLIDVQ